MRMDVLAIIVSSTALLLAGMLYLSRPGVDQRAEFDQLERTQAEDRPADSGWSFGAGLFQDKDPANIERIEKLEQRIAELEQQLKPNQRKNGEGEAEFEVASFSSSLPSPSMQRLMKFRDDPAQAEEHLAELEARAQDYNLTELERIRAIRDHYFASMMVYQDDEAASSSVDAALDIARSTSDKFVKREAWQLLGNLAGVRPELAAELSTLAQEDNDPHMRRIGIRGLQSQLFRASVDSNGAAESILQTLQNIANNDQDSSVRRTAERAVQQARQIQEAMNDPRASLFGVQAIGEPLINEPLIDE